MRAERSFVSLNPPYDQRQPDAPLRLDARLERLPWLGPREVQESSAWPLLGVGGSHSGEVPAHIRDAVIETALHPEYPPTLGNLALRTAIAERLEAEFGRPVDPGSEILITCGSMQALHLVARACGASVGPAVAHAPAFFYADLAAAAGISLTWTDGGDWIPDWAAFRRDLSQTNAALAIVNTPCNPTGYVFGEADIDAIAASVSDSRAWLLSDEAMLTYVYGDARHVSPAHHEELASRTVVVRSFSKMYSMGPWRVGYAYGPAPVISAAAKLLQWSIIGVDSVSQSAALAAIIGPQQWMLDTISNLGERRIGAVDALNRSGVLKANVPLGGAVLWARITDGDWAEEACSRDLRRIGIPAVRGELFGTTTPHLRIPFAGDAKAAKELIEILPTISSARTPDGSPAGD